MSETEPGDNGRSGPSDRWRRREQRRLNRRNQLQKHGAGLRTVYRDAILKRLRGRKLK
jgi:hypothetical protein